MYYLKHEQDRCFGGQTSSAEGASFSRGVWGHALLENFEIYVPVNAILQ